MQSIETILDEIATEAAESFEMAERIQYPAKVRAVLAAALHWYRDRASLVGRASHEAVVELDDAVRGFPPEELARCLKGNR